MFSHVFHVCIVCKNTLLCGGNKEYLYLSSVLLLLINYYHRGIITLPDTTFHKTCKYFFPGSGSCGVPFYKTEVIYKTQQFLSLQSKKLLSHWHDEDCTFLCPSFCCSRYIILITIIANIIG